MKSRLVLVLAFIAVVSGCTSNSLTDTTLDTSNIPEDELKTYTIETGDSSATEVRNIISLRLKDAGISHSIERLEQNTTETGHLELQVKKGENITGLLDSGEFEAVLKFNAEEINEFRYNDSSGEQVFNVEKSGDEYVFGERTYRESEEFKLKGREAYFEEGELIVRAYSSEDITSAGNQRTMSRPNGYQATARLTLSSDAADHFNALLQNYEVSEESRTGGEFLRRSDDERAMMYFRLNGETVQTLTISDTLKERRIDTAQIALTAETEEEVKSEMSQIKSIIASGKLPEDVQIREKDEE